jgi:hypothetical protein
LINKNEIIKQKFEKIKEFVSGKIYANQVVEPYFSIDSVHPEPVTKFNLNDDVKSNEKIDDIEGLRRVIEVIALNEKYMGEQLPIKWMKFEKSLDKLKNKGLFYASLSQVIYFSKLIIFK